MLEMETTYKGKSQEPPMHYHPKQEEKFTVVSGELTVRIGDEVKKFRAGDNFKVPANTPHAMWNDLSTPTTVNWIVTPALNTEKFFENTMGLARDGKIGKNGMPNLLQVALIANNYNHIFRLARPPFPLQRVLFSLLTPIAYLAGYKANYKKYFD